MRSENFFHHDVQRQGVAPRIPAICDIRRFACRQRSRHGLQAPKIFPGCIQAVGMVNAQPVDEAGGKKLAQQPMGILEHLGVIHAQRRQLIYVEEAAVVDFVRSCAPVRQPVGLRFEQVRAGGRGSWPPRASRR